MLKINFKISKEYDLEVMKKFVLPSRRDWDWSYRVFYFHPRLKGLVEEAKNPINKRKVIEEYVRKWYKENKNKLEKKKIIFQEEWNKINKKYEHTIINLLELKKDKNYNLTCFISICPISPRDLKNKDFSIFYNCSLAWARMIIAHEVLHFYYFDKWKEVFPKSNERNFDGPHIIWFLSEILATILLNKREVQTIIKKIDQGYYEFKKCKINGKNIIQHFLYLHNKYKKKKFSDFLKVSYSEIKKYKEKITKI